MILFSKDTRRRTDYVFPNLSICVLLERIDISISLHFGKKKNDIFQTTHFILFKSKVTILYIGMYNLFLLRLCLNFTVFYFAIKKKAKESNNFEITSMMKRKFFYSLYIILSFLKIYRYSKELKRIQN